MLVDTRQLIGIDVGGTFSDFIILDESGEEPIKVFKVPSTPQNPVDAIIQGLLNASTQEQVRLHKAKYLAHGTTVGTNAVIQRKGAKTALITTKGFEDVLEIGRQNRQDLYSLRPKRAVPILQKKDRYGITERVNANGKIQTPLDYKELQSLVHELVARKYESIAVSLLFSFKNPKHEKEIKEELEKKGLLVSVSSEVHPVIREYERTNTTVLDAFVKPLISRYMMELEERVLSLGFHGSIGIMQSNGGMVSVKQSSRKPVSLLLSGLAGGVLAGAFTGKLLGETKLLTIDIGGTSTDVSLVKDDVQIVKEAVLGELPVMTETVDVLTIGAGGGSIARVKEGMFIVGPDSAGADPGPLCYGKGGTQVTVTDADVVTKRLSARNFAGGTMKIYPYLALQGIKALGEELGLSPEETAQGIQEVYRNNIVLALRKISLERGHDPREFTLVPFGGQGPVHGIELAELLGAKKVYIPPFPGVWSAFGLIASPYRQDLTKTIQVNLDEINNSDLVSWFSTLERKGMQKIKEDGFTEKQVTIEWKLDMKYKGQGYELNIPIHARKASDKKVPNMKKKEIQAKFEKTHHQKYGFTFPTTPVQIINVHVTIIGNRPAPVLSKPKTRQDKGIPSPLETRKVFMKNQWQEFKVYEKQELRLHDCIQGPAIIEQADTTVIIPQEWNVTLHETGHFIAIQTKERKA